MNRHDALERTDAMAPSVAPVVLIADPEAETRAVYRDAFIRAGWDVIEATDGRDALAKALPRPPSLVITELRLPFIDGRALCDILRRDPLTAAVPILVVTSAALERVEGIQVDALLRKPAGPDALVQEARRRLMTPRPLRVATLVREAVVVPSCGREPAERLAATNTRRGRLSKARQRFTTESPQDAPPVLSCPSCDRTLKYEQSHVGGVSDRHPEQWDYFVCPAGCGTFQYRHRTRRVRRVDST